MEIMTLSNGDDDYENVKQFSFLEKNLNAVTGSKKI